MFQCPECPKSFETSRALGVHLGKKHGISRTFERTKQQQNLYIRERKIKERSEDPEYYTFECPFCEFRSHNQVGISRHMIWMHLDSSISVNGGLIT